MSETEIAKVSPCFESYPVIAHVVAAIPERIVGITERFVKDGNVLTRSVELRLAPETKGDAA